MILAETGAELRAMAGQKRIWLGMVGAGVVIGLTGPFGTYDTLPLPLRCAYWFVVVVTTFWIGYAVSFATATWAENRGMGTATSLGLGSFLASLPVTAWLASLHAVVFAAPFWADMLRLLPYVLVITVVVAVLSETIELRQTEPAQPHHPPSQPGWLDQLPPRLGRDLILLHAQDHYVRVETALGESLIRARLQDAAIELGGYGLRLHRSWWVARAAIKSVAYRKGALVAVLQDGRELPIGRTYRRAVREALR